MPEIKPSPESSKIPENWKFPERNDPGLQIIQMDPDSGFLAIFSHHVPRGETNIDKQYFFDQEGKIEHFRSRGKFPITVGFTADGIKSKYIIYPDRQGAHIFSLIYRISKMLSLNAIFQIFVIPMANFQD